MSNVPAFIARLRIIAKALEAGERQAKERAIAALHAAADYLEDVRKRAPETATPSLPDDLVASFRLAIYTHTQGDHDATLDEARAILTTASRLLYAAPSLPAVLTDATCRDALDEACQVIDGLVEQQAMPDDFYREPLERFRALLALATSATPVLP